MRLSKKDLRAAARHARELADECVNGTAPVFRTHSYCGCAAGEIVKRLRGVTEIDPEGPLYLEAEAIDNTARDTSFAACGLVSHALFAASHGSGTQHETLPFALLALADALDEAAVNAAQPPSKSVLEES